MLGISVGLARRAWSIEEAVRDHRTRRNSYLKKYHSLTLRDLYAKLVQQDWRCKICGVEFVERVRASGAVDYGYKLDHNHRTGQVRDLLCNACNTLIGSARESQKILQDAIMYLSIWQSF